MQSWFNVYKDWSFTSKIRLPNYCIWLWHWIPNPAVPGSKLLGGYKVKWGRLNGD